MENWIGIGIWIVLGALVGLSMKVLVKQSGERPGHDPPGRASAPSARSSVGCWAWASSTSSTPGP
jgi:hypothetical protein